MKKTIAGTMERFTEDVTCELMELKKLGVYVPARALKTAKDPDSIDMKEYYESGMKVSECASLLMELG